MTATDPCDPFCPFLGCLTCAYSGGVATPPNRDVSAGQTGCDGVELEVLHIEAPPAGNRGLTHPVRAEGLTVMVAENPTPQLPCGHRTRHGQRIGCCAGCRHLFSSDSAFQAHRKRGQCLDPRDAGLVGRPSKTAPGEVLWAMPSDGHAWGGA